MKTLGIQVLIFLGVLVLGDQLLGLILPGYPVYLNSNDEFASNPRGYFRHWRLNEEGQRIYYVDRTTESGRIPDGKELEVASLRILAVGDSFTYGQGVYLEDNFIKVVEREYGAAQDVVGINIAVSGSDVQRVAADTQAYLKKQSVDLVVYGYVLNDALFHAGDVDYFDVNPNPPIQESGLLWDFMNLRSANITSLRPPWLRKISQLSPSVDRYLRSGEMKKISQKTIEVYQNIHSWEKNEAGLNQTFELIEKMRDESQSMGAKFVVLVFPIFFQLEDYPFEQAHKLLRQEFEKREISMIDLLEVFRDQDAASLWIHPSDQHPNEVAHRQSAEALMAWMKKEGL